MSAADASPPHDPIGRTLTLLGGHDHFRQRVTSGDFVLGASLGGITTKELHEVTRAGGFRPGAKDLGLSLNESDVSVTEGGSDCARSPSGAKMAYIGINTNSDNGGVRNL